MTVQASDSGVREAILTALKGVVKHAGKSVSPATRTRVYTVLKDLIYMMMTKYFADILKNFYSSTSVLVLLLFIRNNPGPWHCLHICLAVWPYLVMNSSLVMVTSGTS